MPWKKWSCRPPRAARFCAIHARRNWAVASDLVMRALEDYRVYFQRYELKQPTETLAAELQDRPTVRAAIEFIVASDAFRRMPRPADGDQPD